MNTLTSFIFKAIFLMFILMVWVPIVSASELGNVAPDLNISHWVGKKPIKEKPGNGKTIFVIGFWSTECPYSVMSIPRLNDLQKKYKDKNVVLVSITDEDLKKIEEFVKNNDVGYHVALDITSKTTTENYLTGFGVEGVPHLFIINKEGLVVWHGHPEDEVDRVLDELIEGKYNLQATINSEQAQKLMSGYLYMASQTNEHEITRDIGKRVLYYGNDNSSLLTEFAWVLINDTTIKKRDVSLGLESIKRAYSLTGDKDASVLSIYADILEMTGKADKAKSFREKAEKLTPKPADNEKGPADQQS